MVRKQATARNGTENQTATKPETSRDGDNANLEISV